jgi:hypothetical protein
MDTCSLDNLNTDKNEIWQTQCQMPNGTQFMKVCLKFYSFSWNLNSYSYSNPIFRHIKSNNSETAKVKIVKNERDPPFFTGKLLIKFQNILRNTPQVTIRRRVKILFCVISSPITLERQKWKSSKKKGILLSSPVSSW